MGRREKRKKKQKEGRKKEGVREGIHLAFLPIPRTYEIIDNSPVCRVRGQSLKRGLETERRSP